MRRELLLLREMRDAAVAIRDLVGARSPSQIDGDSMRRSIDDLPRMITQLEGTITTMQMP